MPANEQRVGSAPAVAPASAPASPGVGKRSLVQQTFGNGAPDLHGAPYQWIAGTFNLWVSRAWFCSAADFADSGGQWVAPSRIRELLGALRERGMLAWASPARLAKAADELSITASHAAVVLVKLQTPVFDAVGLPPGTSASVGRSAGNGLDVVIAVEGGTEGRTIALSAPARQQVVTAIERFTRLPMIEAEKRRILAAELQVTLGAGTAHVHMSAAIGAQLFGKAAYERWCAKPAGGGGTAETFGDLTPEEAGHVQRWLAKHVAGGSGHAVATSRALLEAVRAVDALPEAVRQRVLAKLHAPGGTPGELDATLLERLIQQARFDEERAAAGFQPERARADRPPVFDTPLPARIDQASGLVVSGEPVDFTLKIDWPDAATADQASEYTWKPMQARVEWLFERTGRSQQRARTQVDYKHDGHASHRFELARGEDAGVWTVHAFVQHNFFRPTHLVTQVEVKTERQRMQELRGAAFAQLGQPGTDEADHDFATSSVNEALGKRAYDHGAKFRGELPADFQRRTPAERQATLASEIRTNEAMLAYLRSEGTHPDAIAVCEHYLARLRTAAGAMTQDEHAGWQPFEVRGTFLGRGNHIADGPLDLYGAVRRQAHRIPGDEVAAATSYELVHVQIRDLSRRLDAEDYRFEGSGSTFEAALEAVFVDLCKKYPGGKLAILAEGFAPAGTAATGKTVGFELDTGTAWKDAKEKVFDPAINMAVNIAGAIASIFAPEIAIPLLVLYNEAQNIDQLVDELGSDTLTTKRGVMHLAQLGLDVMPMAGRAPVFRASRGAFAVFHVGGLGGQALLMSAQVGDQLAELRDTQVKDMATLFARYLDLEKSTQASDPARTKLKAELDQRAEAIRHAALEVWLHAVASFAAVAVPVHLAAAVHETVRTGRIAALERAGRFSHEDGVAPHYDPQRGQLVGDQARLDPATLTRLTGEQDAHMRSLADRLASKLGVDPARIALKPGAENRLWRDGDSYEARYAASTDPEQALAKWERDARPSATRPAAHGTEARETTAAAVPGSQFRSGARPANAEEVAQNAHELFERTGQRFPEIKHIQKASSERVTRAPDRQDYEAAEKLRIEHTYIVSMEKGPAFSVRITSGPTGGAVARTIVNTEKTGMSRVASPDGEVTEVRCEGRYVVQLSETMDLANVERALSHELGEILGERELAKTAVNAARDQLRANTVPTANAVLSPHDRGRLSEIKVLAARVDAGEPAAMREMIALVEELGLRDGMTGSAERRLLAKRGLGDDVAALRALEATAKPEAQLAPDQRAQLESVRDARAKDLHDTATREASEKPLHDRPDAGVAPGQRVSLARAQELAQTAEALRARKSAETITRLRAEAAALAAGQYPRVRDVQIGGGASLAARDTAALLIDKRGRWQADASDRIAQTAAQLAGIKRAGLGDPFQFAEPNERVPMSAVRYWEDSIAAQGPVINGEVTSIAHQEGKTVITVAPSDGGAELLLEVEGNILAATGFPAERIPGTPYKMSPHKAIDAIKAKLNRLIEDSAVDPTRKERAREVLGDIGDLGGYETRQGQRAADLAKVKASLEKHGLAQTMQTELGDAYQMAIAGERWHQLTTEHPKRFALGDIGNLDSLDAFATDNWVIGGLGGTGVSAAEIILTKNEKSHVTMMGPRPPEGLPENTQFMGMVEEYCDEVTAARITQLSGNKLSTGTGRLSLVFGVMTDMPNIDQSGRVQLSGKGIEKGVPVGYNEKNNPIRDAGGYIPAIGREGQLPAFAVDLKRSIEAQGGRMTMTPMYSRERFYTHYRLNVLDAKDSSLRHIDVTGAASRFPPWDLFDGSPQDLEQAQRTFAKASDIDAPPEGGNFDGGFASSGGQAERYARAKQRGEF